LSNRLPVSQEAADGSSRYALLLLNVPGISDASTGQSAASHEPRDSLMAKSNCLAQAASKAGIAVVYAHRQRRTVLPAALQRGSTGKSIGKGGTKGRSEPHSKTVCDYNFTWRGSDPFSNWEIDYFLSRKGINHLFLAGVDSSMSIKQTAQSALAKGYRVTFVQDCIFTVHEDRWQRVLKDFEAAAAFSIKSEEFAEFAMAVQQANDPHRPGDDDGLEPPPSTPLSAEVHRPSQA